MKVRPFQRSCISTQLPNRPAPQPTTPKPELGQDAQQPIQTKERGDIADQGDEVEVEPAHSRPPINRGFPPLDDRKDDAAHKRKEDNEAQNSANH